MFQNIDELKKEENKNTFIGFQLENKALIIDFLNKVGFLNDKETVISAVKPGEGNMNFVARIITNQRSFILKQSNNYVQKYPQIAAPIERIFSEASFYKTIEEFEDLACFMPKILLESPNHHAIVLEDLGESTDFMSLYRDSSLLNGEIIESLVMYLNKLHHLKPVYFPENMAMKILNHEHIFNFPFNENNGLDLDNIQQGLQNLSIPYKQNEVLKEKINELGALYLQKGNTLLHGDFYPGSWLNTEKGIKVIDPEFCFLGRAEFDLGVNIAHLYLSKNERFVSEILSNYKECKEFNNQVLWGFVGVEIMRRLLGIAQLPVTLTLSEKEKLLQKASNFINDIEVGLEVNYKNKKPIIGK